VTPPARLGDKGQGTCGTAARLAARAGPTDKTSEALPLLLNEQKLHRLRSTLNAEGGAPLTDSAGGGRTAAADRATKDQLARWRARP
jgi:hypothetical protein